MFFRKAKKNCRVLSLTAGEATLIRKAMLRLRNRAIREGLPTQDLDALIVRMFCLVHITKNDK